MGEKFHHMGQHTSDGTLVKRNLFQVIFPCFFFLLFRFLTEGIETALHFPFAEPFQRQHRQCKEEEEGQGDGNGKSQHGYSPSPQAPPARCMNFGNSTLWALNLAKNWGCRPVGTNCPMALPFSSNPVCL